MKYAHQRAQSHFAKLSTLFFVTALSACGGGGSDSSPTTPEPITPPVTTPPTTVDLPTEFSDYLTGLADGIIVPNYQSMQTSALALAEATTDFCALQSPSVNDLSTLQNQWKTLNLAWQSIQWVKIGPIVTDNRLFRIQFWPDGNNAVERGVNNLLLEAQTSEVTAAAVSTQNVGGQGLPALEMLFFPSQQSESILQASNANERCEVASAISQNLLNITTDIVNEWDATQGNYRAQLIEGTGEFTSVTDAVEELVTNWLEALEIVKDEKMLFPLGSEAPGDLSASEHVLSDQALESILANIQSFKALYSNNDNKGFDAILSDALDQTEISEQMSTSINNMLVIVERLNTDYDTYDQVLADASARAEVEALIEEIRVTRDYLSSGFIQALDINIGFNSNDGD
jgi:predicted lipoprotein